MKTLHGAFMTLAFCLGVGLHSSAFADPPARAENDSSHLHGFWLGTVDYGWPGKVRLIFKIEAAKEGRLSATLGIPEEGLADLPVADAAMKGGVLRLHDKATGGTFEGKPNKESTEIVGTWKQFDLSFPVTLKSVPKAPDTSRPQDPKKPFPYAEDEITFENKKARITLAGTLTCPKTKGPHPVALLISGAGPNDRNQALGGHKPFLVLSDHLTRNGIAVLRVDDRGVGRSTGRHDEATIRDFADDVLAGVEYLKSRKEIDATRIGLIGHSEGGVVAPMVAAESKDIAFVVLLAGSGLRGDEILHLQGESVYRAGGAQDKDVATQRKLQDVLFKAVQAHADYQEARKQVQTDLNALSKTLSEEDRADLVASEPTLDLQLRKLMTPYFRHFLRHDPRSDHGKVRCPVLAINGGRDLLVPPKQNLPEIEKALRNGGNRDVTVKELPGLNHFFQTAKTGSVAEVAAIQETLAPIALNAVSDWILVRVR